MTKEQSYTRFWEGSKRMWITFLFFSFIMIGFVQAANTAFAQTTVTVNVQDATLSDVLWEIQRQTDFTFLIHSPTLACRRDDIYFQLFTTKITVCLYNMS